jgi:DNA polymerase zeta
MEISRSGVLGQNATCVANNRLRTFKMEIFDDELDLLNGVADLVIELDPDILAGWEVQLNSWGFLEARARIHGTSVSLTDSTIMN